jgi:hypothetical protein
LEAILTPEEWVESVNSQPLRDEPLVDHTIQLYESEWLEIMRRAYDAGLSTAQYIAQLAYRELK